MTTLKYLRKVARQNRRYQIEQRVIRAYGEGTSDYKLIMKACDLSTAMHSGGKRRNNDPKISHDRGVFLFLHDHNGLRDPEQSAAGIMHDAVEDYFPDWTFDRLQKELSRGVRDLVEPVTKLEYAVGTDKEEFLLQYALGIDSAGEKAVQIKLCDNTHNQLTLVGSLEKRQTQVSRSMRFYIPLAVKYDFMVSELSDVVHVQRINCDREKQRLKKLLKKESSFKQPRYKNR